MKKKILIIVIVVLFFLLDATVSYAKKEINNKTLNYQEIRGVYISYLEYYSNFYGNSISINKNKIDEMIKNIREDNFNLIILHVSPFSDSIYNSHIMPYSITLTGKEGKYPGFDYLDYFIKKAHQNNILLYAWINPYRVSFDSDINSLSDDNPARKMVNTSNILIDKKGIYYNPASELVKDLIISQVEEIINNYNVDGIHFDDYFYIQSDISKIEYNNYQGDMTYDEFRLFHTNDLIERVYKKIKDINSNITFSIAPDGCINNNYLYHFADVKSWLSNNNYIDIIMPQIYYGFENEYGSFDNVLDLWLNLVKANIKVAPVLSFYKSGSIDNSAGSGKNEWLNNSDILKRQINLIRNKNLYGYSLFRYDYMYNKDYQNKISQEEMLNIKKLNKNMVIN